MDGGGEVVWTAFGGGLERGGEPVGEAVWWLCRARAGGGLERTGKVVWSGRRRWFVAPCGGAVEVVNVLWPS